MSIQKLKNYNLKEAVPAAPLAVFRILFGFMMLVSIIRFASYGWIEKFYLEPDFFFTYYGFSWVQPLGDFTYVLFLICGISALFVMVGYRYRVAIILFFLSFTYIELMDKTTYLNHYYFISCLAFLLMLVPAHVYYSIDARRDSVISHQYIPRWMIDILKLMLVIVYFYAGIAKINTDWMLHALPLKIWLPGGYDMPLIGGLLQQGWVAYFFSWGGAAYDILIPFLLLWPQTRTFAFAGVVVFHVLTRILFPIGMFPYIMILSALIFFGPELHSRLLIWISRMTRIDLSTFDNGENYAPSTYARSRFVSTGLIVFFAFQIVLPLRYLAYPDSIYWTEEGYRYSWRVMLMEKAGYAQFKIVDGHTGRRFYVDNTDFLTGQQEKMMSTQPDMIVQYAHFLGEKFAKDGHQNVEVYVESYVALNGRPSHPYIDPAVDLMTVDDSWTHKKWILDGPQKLER